MTCKTLDWTLKMLDTSGTRCHTSKQSTYFGTRGGLDLMHEVFSYRNILQYPTQVAEFWTNFSSKYSKIVFGSPNKHLIAQLPVCIPNSR